MKSLSIASMLLAGGLLAGCASSGSSNAPTTTPSPAQSTPTAYGTTASSTACKAECLVCKKNADLACVDVDVDKKTPSYVYNGHTYYFCSNECKNEFARNPQKYLSTK